MGVSAISPGKQRGSRQIARNSEAAFDDIDVKLLELLQTDGRLSLSELGRRVNLSAAAVTERVKRLEAEGTITGYTATVSAARLGYRMAAFVRISPHAGIDFKHPKVRAVLSGPEIREAHHVIGDDCWILKVAVADVEHLERLLEQLSGLGRTTTSIVMSTPIQAGVLTPLDHAR